MESSLGSYELVKLREDKIKGPQKQIPMKNNYISLEKLMKDLLIDKVYWGTENKGFI